MRSPLLTFAVTAAALAQPDSSHGGRALWIPPIAPRVTRLEVFATDAQERNVPEGSPGDTWGGHQSRIVRLSSGELYAVYLRSPEGIDDPAKAEWVLKRRGALDADSWVQVARARAGREPMHLLRGRDDTLYILSWPLRPRMWTFRVGVLDGPRTIPGGWEEHRGSSTPYGGAAIADDGRIFLVSSRGDLGSIPDAEYTADSAWDLAVRDANEAWSVMRTLPIGLRYCYPYVHARAGSGFELVGQRDVRWEALGLDPPPDEFAYVFDAVDVWSFASVQDASPARTPLGMTPYEEPAENAPYYRQSDSHIDRHGRLHVLIQSRRTNGEWAMHHLVRRTSGELIDVPIVMDSYTDGELRLIEDPYGRLYLLFIQSRDQRLYPLIGTEGLQLGPRLDLTPMLGGLDAAGPAYITCPRGGTPTAPVVDLLIAFTRADGTTITRSARIELYAER